MSLILDGVINVSLKPGMGRVPYSLEGEELLLCEEGDVNLLSLFLSLYCSFAV